MRTVLPKEWCIEINDTNKSILEPYWKSIPKTWKGDWFHGWLMSYGYGDGSYMSWTTDAPCEQITFEEFECLVLNKPQQLTYEIY